MSTQPITYLDLLDEIEGITTSDTGQKVRIRSGEPSRHFLPMQIPQEGDGVKAIQDVDPVMEGSAEKPDMLLQLKMLGFNVGAEDKLGRAEKAIMQLKVGQASPTEGKLEPLFWMVSAGLELYSNVRKKEKAEFKDLAVSVDQALNKDYIEIPGGGATMQFKVVKDREPQWWSQIFNFVKSDTGMALTAAIGLPGIPQIAVRTFETLFEKFGSKRDDVLFESKHVLGLAVSKYALDKENTHARKKVGVLNPGMFLLARGMDFGFFKDTPGKFDTVTGKYYPEIWTSQQIIEGIEQNPFDAKTFAVFEVAMQETNLKNKYDFTTG